MSAANEAQIPLLSSIADQRLDKRAATVLHDLNNPLSFLLANHMIEQEHSDVLQTLLNALVDLQDPRVNCLLEEFAVASRLEELSEILDDNGTGLERLRIIAKQLRVVMTSMTDETRGK